jgi:hypothetical protein
MRSIIPWSRCAPFYSYLRTALSINCSLKGRRMAEAESQILHRRYGPPRCPRQLEA